ncbi:MAG: GNAT family N-acetyltransferase [Bacteroidetes bacterium]|nr:GNAT family N-acetyltransferase [Bacteroidota bacterium]
MPTFHIRDAEPADVELILSFIRELAVYEKMEDEVVADETTLSEYLFDKKSCHCILAFENDLPIGFALYFFNFSTFVGKQGLYLEDLFVKPEHRGKGYGKKLLFELMQIAKQKKCARMEWAVLNWNTPAIEFYKSIGAKAMSEWTVYRMTDSQF